MIRKWLTMPFDFLCCVRVSVEDVVELDYSRQALADVPGEVFVHERTLEELRCHGNRITELPRQLFMCHGLKHLDLSDNELQTIPVAISSLVNLQVLNINRNALANIPDTMKSLKYLAFLDLSANPLEKLPDAITNLTALQELYLNDTYLEYLPGNFGRLAQLRILELRDNYLMILPKSLSRSTELERLDIGQNEFQQFPDVIGRFLKLKELWIDGNSLTEIPDVVKTLENLIHLEASNNMLEEIAPEIGYCTKLVDITLSSNTLTQLPDSIGQLCNLTALKLDNNRLYSLPDSIGSLKNLEELMLLSNYLDVIPTSIGLLRKLQYLNVDENLLRCIPPEIGSCVKLSVLSARSNKITRIPPEIGHLSSLRVLNLVGNALSCLPQSLLNCDNLVALWLSENQSKPLVPMHSEVEPRTYEQVLTCFLFPQVPLSPIESKIDNDKSENTDTQTASRHISFVDMKVTPKVPEKPGQLRRAPTPYPKELRALAKHARNIHKDGTQDVTPPMQNAVQIKAAKITPTLQQRFASDNKLEIDNVDHPNDPMKVSIYDNIQPENAYDKPLDLTQEHDTTYKSVDHALYPEKVSGDSESPVPFPRNQGIYSSVENGTYSGKQDIQVPAVHQEYYSRNLPQENYGKEGYRSSLNEVHNRLQRLSISSQDRRSNSATPLASHYEESPYGKMPVTDNRHHYEHLPQRCHAHTIAEDRYQGSVHESDGYGHAVDPIYGPRHYDQYSYHGHGHEPAPAGRVATVSHAVSGSTTMPNLSRYGEGYARPDERPYAASLQRANANRYQPSPTYVAAQSPELYSPTGHTDLTNPYRMTNTPLLSEDGGYAARAPAAQYDPYGPGQAPEPAYARAPPPYHVAAPYTKHAQYFNGSGG